MYSQLQLREIFHLEFLRYLAADMPLKLWALKGGVNLRLFFKSVRYSEDMDLDVDVLPVDSVKKRVLRILTSPSFLANLKTYGIEKIVLPDMGKAKQTGTTQRFKVHLITASGDDHFTKVEFSRRGLRGEPVVQSAPASVLRPYGMAPLMVPHYSAAYAAAQKISAVLSRSTLQARDIFDLYLLSTQVRPETAAVALPDKAALAKARERILEPDFKMFRDTVAAYLAAEDQGTYAEPAAWDEVKLKAAEFVGELEKNNG